MSMPQRKTQAKSRVEPVCVFFESGHGGNESYFNLRSGATLDTTKFWNAKNTAERTATVAWNHYKVLVQTGGSGPDRLEALRAAIKADNEALSANEKWRAASGVGW